LPAKFAELSDLVDLLKQANCNPDIIANVTNIAVQI